MTFKQYLLLALVACVAPVRAAAQESPLQLDLVQWASGLGTALYVTNCGDDRLFVVRQYGAINIVSDSNVVLPTPFLDISSQVLYNGERGLLGLCFDPDYATNGHFYVNYTTGSGNGTTHISRFTVSANPNIADPASEVVLLTLPQPDPIHQSGSLMFGPDGYLYVALGDGGGASDPNDYGQNPTNVYGTIIRIDVQDDGTYTIPPDNPYVGNTDGWREEIWAWGLRNPYRMDVDPLTGDIWMGDVGQSLWEEIDFWPGGDNSGPNFGWRCYEGNNVFNLAGCIPPSNFVFPVAEHAHAVNGGNFCAIVGGKVYRGSNYPRMFGKYLYTDFCAGEIRIIDPADNFANTLGGTTGAAGNTSIGRDQHGEFYATNLINGRIYKIKDRCPMDRPEVVQDGSELVSTDATSYQWYQGNTMVPGAVGQAYEPTMSGYYRVLAGFGTDCFFFSDSALYIFTGLRAQPPDGLRIYPQPATDIISLSFDVATDVQRTVLMHDVHGRQVMSVVVPSGASLFDMDVSSMAAGTYALEVVGNSGQTLHRRTVVVTR